MGVIHIGFNDFCLLTIDEFNATAKAFNDYEEAKYKDGWERMRLAANITIQPHLKRKLAPQKMLPLPWEKPSARKRKGIPVKGDRERFNALLEKYGRKYHGKEDKERLANNGKQINN